MTGASSLTAERDPLPRGVEAAEHRVAGEHDEFVLVDDSEPGIAAVAD